MAEIKQVKKRSGVLVPFNKGRISNAIYRAAVAVGGRDKEKADELADEVIKLLTKNNSTFITPTIEEIQDAVEKVLIENGHAKVAKAFILYREEANKRRESSAEKASHPSENIPWAKLHRILDWSVTKNLFTIEQLNERIQLGEFSQIVHESESAYEEDIKTAAEMIAERSKDLKMVLITGPSSSGKTTTTLKLEQRLEKRGLHFLPLVVDNYFFDLEMHPKDEFGDYDFETPQALDLEMINDHLQKLCSGEQVVIPFYDFKTGTRYLNRTPIQLKENEILLIDSLRGLYPPMTTGINDQQKFKLYLEPLMQMKDNNGKFIRWTDIRLMRRMLRDWAFRAYNPQQTLEHWHYVRASELRNIIPYNNTADFIINSAMPYELPVYSHKLADKFIEWEENLKNNPLKNDAYQRALRVKNILASIKKVDDESAIPGDSVIREFIGGSTLNYH
ncbi:MAG: response regulator SirA [Ignavibacteriales bacterium]|nr:response regulator SirA [Ignavibacteriales bacterium]